MIINIQSLPTHIHSLRQYILEQSSHAPKIIAVIESQVPNSSANQLAIDGYNHSHFPAPASHNQSNSQLNSHQTHRGGGLVLYTHVTVGVQHQPTISLIRLTAIPSDANYGRTSCIHWFRVRFENSTHHTMLGVVYLSPKTHSSEQAINQLRTNISDVMDSLPQTNVIVAGDFNLRTSLWDPTVTPSIHASSRHHARAAMFHRHLTTLSHLTLLNTCFPHTRHVPTRPGRGGVPGSVVDLCYASESALDVICKFEIGKAAFADHYPLHVTIATNKPLYHTPPILQSSRWRIHDNSSRWRDLLAAEIESTASSDLELTANLASLNSSMHAPTRAQAQSLIQRTWQSFVGSIEAAMEVCIGRSKRTKYHWFTPPVQQQHAAISRARQRWRANRRGPTASIHLAAYRVEQETFRTMVTKARAASLSNLYESILPGPQSPLLWTAMARLRTSKAATALGTIANADGSLPLNQTQSLNNLCKKFIQFTIPDRDVDRVTARHLQAYINRRCEPINQPNHPSNEWRWTAENVSDQCGFQRNHKSAAGPDNIPPVVLKYLPHSAYHNLSIIFNYSWKNAVMPIEWVSANVFSLLKDPKKPLSDPGNYRPIAVTSIFIRTFEHLIHRRLTPLIDSPNIQKQLLHAHQFGFRAKRSCQDGIHMIVSAIQKEQCSSRQARACIPTPVAFIDLKKAFDRVSHNHLMYTLERHFNLTGAVWLWIYHWLTTNRRMRCVSQSFMSDWHDTSEYAVPQGAVLSPLLFLLFINPIAVKIAEQCPLIDMPLFADDVAIAPKSNTEFNNFWNDSNPLRQRERAGVIRDHQHEVERNFKKNKMSKQLMYREILTAVHMQRALSLFSAWLAQVGMEANAAKSKVVVFTCSPPVNQPWLTNPALKQSWFENLELDGFILSLTTEYDYLGVTLDCNLNWEAHTQKVTSKVAATAGMISGLFQQNRSTPHPLAAVKLVKSLILPVISYGIEFWLNSTPPQSKVKHASDILHNLILQPIRIASNLPRSTHRLGILVDFGLTSVHDLANQSIYRYYQKHANSTIHADARIHQAVTSIKTLFTGNPIKHFHPSVTRTLQDAFYPSIIPAIILRDRRWMTLGAKARFITEPSFNSLLIKAANIPIIQASPLVRDHRIHPPSFSPPSNLNIIPPINPSHISKLSQLATFIQWQDQWKSRSPNHKRGTSAPLTHIKREPQLVPLILYIDDKQAVSILMRLRHGRAFTHDARARFETAKPSPLCRHPVCEAALINDSVTHLLLECPRHQSLRMTLFQEWKRHCYGRFMTSVNDLKLHQLLGEAPGNHDRRWKNKFRAWYVPLAIFIIAVNNNLPITADYPIPL